MADDLTTVVTDLERSIDNLHTFQGVAFVDDGVGRIVLAGLIAVAVFQYAAVVAPHAVKGGWRHGWPTKIMLAGGMGFGWYLFLGQFKAMLLDVPFDGLSVFGVIVAVVFDVGSFLVLRERHRCGRN